MIYLDLFISDHVYGFDANERCSCGMEGLKPSTGWVIFDNRMVLFDSINETEKILIQHLSAEGSQD